MPSDNESEAEFEQLPEEIRERWEAAHADKSESDRREAMRILVQNRKKALRSPQHLAPVPTHVEVQPGSTDVQEMIKKVADGAHEALGQGQSGRVIAPLRNPDVAFKVFFPRIAQPTGTNDIALEAELQNAIASRGEKHGVRVPRIHYFLRNDAMRAIAMERLHAVSVMDVLDGVAPLPAAFDRDRFHTALNAYVGEMNAAGYYHRDLHAGNVLIDTETGMPYIIDFGMSRFAPTGEDVYRIEIPSAGQMRIFMLISDDASLRKLREQTQSFSHSEK